MNTPYRIISRGIQETMALGARLGKHLKVGDLVALVGVFGAGKTYFTKGLAQGLGIKRVKEVISPSFILCKIYKGKRLSLYHFDAQRLPDAQEPEGTAVRKTSIGTADSEFFKLGFLDALSNGVCVLEWADKWPGLTGQPNILEVKFVLKGKTKRLLEFRGNDKRWIKIIRQLRKEIV